VASEYLNGRSVYFYFSPEDFLSNLFSNLAGHRNASGVPQSAVASALIDSAIVWAATDDGVPGRIVRSGKTSGELKVYQDGIYAFQYVRVDGNVSLSGQAYFRVYDPAGRLVYSKRHPATYVGTYPGGSLRFAYQYVPGALMSGKYRVEVEYVYGYPKMDRRYKEVAYVVRGQGTGIKTQPALPSATAVSKVTNAYFAPQPITPNNDGWADWGYATFSTDQPAMVTVKVYDLNWKLLAVPQPDKVLAPGRYSVRFAGAGSAGALPNGAYYYSIQTYNDKGKSSSGGVLYIHRTLGKAPALGTKPVLGDTIASPSPFSASTAIKFNLSATAWTSVKVFGPSGAEVRTLVNNARIGTGDLSVRWDGRDSSGALCPNGTYRYYVFTSGGGSAPYTRFKDGTVRISR
jgi:flagellar hook assembly protein FlgD